VTRVLALDVGSTKARALVWEADGTPVAGAEATELHRGLEDPDELVTVVKALAAAARAAAGPVDAVGTSCFWHSLLALDARGRPLTPILPWRNTGAADDADALARRLDADAVHQRTGCVLHPSYWPAKLAWLRRTQPETWRAAARFVSFGEYLLARLAGGGPMSVSAASGTGLLGVRTLDWDEELLAVLELDRERLPPVSDEPVGTTEPWFPALGDGACANVGVGCVERDRAALTVGTSAAFRVLRAGRPEAVRPGLFLLRLDAARLVEGGAFSDGGNLWYWLRRVLRLPRAARITERVDEHGLTFVPLLGGERSPGWDARARGALAGLTFDTTAEDVLQAAMEGVALRIAEVAEQLPEVRLVVLSGGAMARQRAWPQLVADALDLPVARARVPEASARGAALVALERLGVEPPATPVAAPHEPRPGVVERLRAARERQRALAAAVK
jgi:gluconokinase